MQPASRPSCITPVQRNIESPRLSVLAPMELCVKWYGMHQPPVPVCHMNKYLNQTAGQVAHKSYPSCVVRATDIAMEVYKLVAINFSCPKEICSQSCPKWASDWTGGQATFDTLTGAFCQGHALLRVRLWKGDTLLWGTTNVLTPALNLLNTTDWQTLHDRPFHHLNFMVY